MKFQDSELQLQMDKVKKKLTKQNLPLVHNPISKMMKTLINHGLIHYTEKQISSIYQAQKRIANHNIHQDRKQERRKIQSKKMNQVLDKIQLKEILIKHQINLNFIWEISLVDSQERIWINQAQESMKQMLFLFIIHMQLILLEQV